MEGIIPDPVKPREAKAALRALKSSLMSKKNMFDVSAQASM